jgi:hypothetical protein
MKRRNSPTPLLLTALLVVLAAVMLLPLPAAAQRGDDARRGPEAGSQRTPEQRQRSDRPQQPPAQRQREGMADRGRPMAGTMGGPMAGPMGEVMAALRDADLSAEQRQEIRRITREHREAVGAWDEEHEEALSELRGQMRRQWRQQAEELGRMRELHGGMNRLLWSDEPTEAITGELTQLRSQWLELRRQTREQSRPLREQRQELYATAPSPLGWLDAVTATLTDAQREQLAGPLATIRERLEKADGWPMGAMNLMGPRPGRHMGPGMGPDMTGRRGTWERGMRPGGKTAPDKSQDKSQADKPADARPRDQRRPEASETAPDVQRGPGRSDAPRRGQ